MSEIATENVTADDGNVIPLRPGGADAAPRAAAEQPQPPPRHQEDAPRRKRRTKTLTNAEALAWVREKGEVTVDSYAALGLVWGWERSRTSKAVKAWARAGDVDLTEAGRGGKITIRIPAVKPARETGETAGKSRPVERENDRESERESHRESEREIPREIDRENARPITEVEQETAPIPAREAAPAAPAQQPPASVRATAAVHDDGLRLDVMEKFYLTVASLAALGLRSCRSTLPSRGSSASCPVNRRPPSLLPSSSTARSWPVSGSCRRCETGFRGR
jgi:hypothetical protein